MSDEIITPGRRDHETYISICKALAQHPRATASLRLRFLELIQRFAGAPASIPPEVVTAIPPASDEAIEIFKEINLARE